MLLDTTDLVKGIKKAAMDAVKSGQPSDFCFGKVTNVSPLKIQLDQKLILGSAQLVLSRNVTDFELQISIKDSTESTSLNASHTHNARMDVNVNSELTPNDNNVTVTNTVTGNITIDAASSDSSHSHSISGKKTITVHNSLKVNDEVILLKQSGGQKYLVIDRVVTV